MGFEGIYAYICECEEKNGTSPFYAASKQVCKSAMKMGEKYAAEANKSGRFHLLGRLAEYRYYNMDATVEKALALCDELLK